MNESGLNSYGRNTSYVVTQCHICKSKDLHSILFLGYLPPVNTMHPIGTRPAEQSGYPAELLQCSKCKLVQLGLAVDPKILFPSEYPYTSSTTKILKENFAEMYNECRSLMSLDANDLVVDIGSNDGNLLSNFKNRHKVQGVTPEEIGKIAISKGIPTIISYFSKEVVKTILAERGRAKVITATNVFAHIDGVNEIVKCILELLDEEGVFITECHYLGSLIETLQYDTIYHEHLMYYSLHSLKYLLEQHGLEIFHAKKIPTHGGSIRAYVSKKGNFETRPTVSEILNLEKEANLEGRGLTDFKNRVVTAKMELHSLLLDIKKQKKKIYGIGAPSRASTLINYVGIDNGIMDYVLEIKGSHKIGKYIPGTLIPVLDEMKLYEDQPEYALLLSWHIADELAPKIAQIGFKGDFIVPLPIPRILKNPLK
tara:strand:- start:946 stop:2223 length:1278 start_codon:yes stop_codon:yes gene_type:complete